MNRQQLVDQIAAIDRLIGELRDRHSEIERSLKLGHGDRVSEIDLLAIREQQGEVRNLVEQKRLLRIEISEFGTGKRQHIALSRAAAKRLRRAP